MTLVTLMTLLFTIAITNYSSNIEKTGTTMSVTFNFTALFPFPDFAVVI